MIKTSTGVQDLRRRIAIKAKAEKEHPFWGFILPYLETRHSHGSLPANQIEQMSARYRSCHLYRYRNEARRTLKIATIKVRVVQGAVKLILEPIFEIDFQDGSFGYRPGRTAHQALARIRNGINFYLDDAIDLDLKSYFDTIRDDILLREISRRVDDSKMMGICKQILKTAGPMGVPQGSLVGPLCSNIYLTNVDKMLEKAKDVTRHKGYTTVDYARFADDLVILVSRSRHSKKIRLLDKVQLRLKQELAS